MDIGLLKKSEDAKKFTDGQVIIQEGDKTSDDMFIILEGQVGVYKNKKKLAQLGAGDVFGEMTLFLHKERSVTVIALGDVVLLAIGRRGAIEFIQKQPLLVGSIMKTLCQRLEDTNNALGRADTHGGFADEVPQESIF